MSTTASIWEAIFGEKSEVNKTGALSSLVNLQKAIGRMQAVKKHN